MTPPPDFVVFPFSKSPRRYVRNGDNDWNVYQWTFEGMWDWDDSYRDEDAAEVFRNTIDVFVLRKRGEQ